MKRRFANDAIVIGLASLIGLFAFPYAAADKPAASPSTLDDLAADKAKIVDLTHALNESSPYWPGGNYESFKLKTIATIEKDGVLSKAFSMPEHCGTHIDAPNHFEKGQPSVDQIAPKDLFAPGVVIDVSAEAARDADFLIEPEHIATSERRYGGIPESAVVFLDTGWARFCTHYCCYKNQDPMAR